MKRNHNEPRAFTFGGFEPGGLDCMPCCFCASQGFTFGGIDGILCITHGPKGCSYHLSNTYKSVFSTALAENDVIFGGEEKLLKAIDEAVRMYSPKAIAVFNTCVSGIIGDKTEKVCKLTQEKYGIKVIPVTCEGFKNIPGFDLASGVIASEIYEAPKEKAHGKYRLNYLASCYDGENKIEFDEIFSTLGYEIVTNLFSHSKYDKLLSGNAANLIISERNRPVKTYIKVMKRLSRSNKACR